MYGNQTLPGVAVSETYKVTKGSIWLGYPEATWFKTVKVNGTDGTDIPAGTVMKEVATDGSYTPISESDIITESSGLPGVRLAIVADKSAETENSVLVGISGIVDKAKLFVGETAFADLTDAQKIGLNTQLEAWNFQLVNVTQA